MGVSCSCPLSVYCDLENGFESAVLNLVENYDYNPLVRSVSFKIGPETTLSPSSSLKPVDEGSVRFKSNKPQTMRFLEYKCQSQATNSILPRSDSSMVTDQHSEILDPSSPKHEAAVKLQKVYKSFRTRRKLADCAVIIEQSWWKLLDFAELKHSSISFFDLEKHETAISRWSRARTRAAKVGKGLSKNSKAQKLALQHWLEAIDPRHRYGHNLHFYYVKWLHSQSKEPFFYWLDIGEGKEVNLVDKCPRTKLQQQCIKYLGPLERKAYEVAVEDGKLLYKQTGELLNITNEPEGSKWIFVLSTSRTLYVGKKKKGYFQHSSFLAGGATLAAGRIVAEEGVLRAVWPHSGHYRPTPENFQDFLSFLRENNVDLSNVKLDPADDDEDSVGKKGGVYLRSNSSEEDLTEKEGLETEEQDINEDSSSDKADSLPKSRSPIKNLTNRITSLQIPSKDDLLERLKAQSESNGRNSPPESPLDGYETAEELLDSEPGNTFKTDVMSKEEHEETEEEVIPEEAILQRINSNKEQKSFQLGQRLSCKWCTGAGPRIGCLRDYPSELQGHALEQVNLSPRSKRRLRLDYPSRSTTPTSNLSCSSSRH